MDTYYITKRVVREEHYIVQASNRDSAIDQCDHLDPEGGVKELSSAVISVQVETEEDYSERLGASAIEIKTESIDEIFKGLKF